MKCFKKLSLFILLFVVDAYSATDFIQCHSTHQTIFDLFEATQNYKLTLDDQLPSVKENAEAFAEKMGRLLNIHPSQILSTASSIQQRFVLTTLNNKRPFGENCSLHQISQDNEEDQILVDQSTWQSMNPFEQTAMVFHESFAAINSVLDRKFIAFLFSTTELIPVEKDIPKKNKMCAGGGNELGTVFYIFPSEKGSQLQFWTIAGQNIFTKTTVNIPQFQYEWLESNRFKNLKGDVKNLKTFSQVYNDIPLDFVWSIHGEIKKVSVRVMKNQEKVTVPLDCDY